MSARNRGSPRTVGVPQLRAGRARRRHERWRLDDADDRGPRADLHRRRRTAPRPPAPPRVVWVDTREEMPARRRPLARDRGPRSSPPRPSTRRAGFLPVRVRARRQPRRGHHRRPTSSSTPDEPTSCLDRGRARPRPGVGRQDDRDLPHLRDPDRAGSRRGRRSRRRVRSRCCPTAFTHERRPCRDPRAGRELGRVARRRRLGAVPHRLARRRLHDGDLVPGPCRRLHPRQPRGLRARRQHPPLPRRRTRSTSPATARSRRPR